jgi:hypothetical protein
MKHADNCAPTLLKFQNEALSFDEEQEKQSRCTVAEIGIKQQESKPHPIYSVVRHRPHDL